MLFMVRSKHLIKIINKEIIGFQDPPQSHESLYNFNTKILSSPIVLQVCYARLLDYKRKFIEAAQRYLDLSYNTAIHDDERMTALKHALICAILASAGMLY